MSIDLTYNGYLLVNVFSDSQGHNNFICLKTHKRESVKRFDKDSLWSLKDARVIAKNGNKILTASLKDGIIKAIDFQDIETGASLWKTKTFQLSSELIDKRYDDLKYATNGNYILCWRVNGITTLFRIDDGYFLWIGDDLKDFSNDGTFDGNRFAAFDDTGSLAIFDLKESYKVLKKKLPFEKPWQLVALKGNLVYIHDGSVTCFDLDLWKTLWKTKPGLPAEIDRKNTCFLNDYLICSFKPTSKNDHPSWIAISLEKHEIVNGGSTSDRPAAFNNWIADVFASDELIAFRATIFGKGWTATLWNEIGYETSEVIDMSTTVLNNDVLVAINKTDSRSNLMVVNCNGNVIGEATFEKNIAEISTHWNTILVRFGDGTIEVIRLKAVIF